MQVKTATYTAKGKEPVNEASGQEHHLSALETSPVKSVKTKKLTTSLDFESQLWATADQLRGSMDASEFKHPVLGLIFLKYISDRCRGSRRVHR